MLETIEFYNFDKKIEKNLNRIKSIDKNTYEKVLEFIKKLQANNYSKSRICKYLVTLKTLRILLKKDFNEATKEDFENLVIKINNSDYSENTKSDFKKILKFYVRWLKFDSLEGKYPEAVEWIKTSRKKNKEKVPEQILTKEEIELMASKTNNLMEKAFVLCLYESGCRISEFLNIKLKDINFDDYGAVIFVTGKTGWRRVRILDYSRDLLNWIDSHPKKTDNESYLWINSKNLKRIDPSSAYFILKKLGRKAGIKKAYNPHSFRHARATHLANVLTEAQMKAYFGWTGDSRMASVYIHLSGEDVDNALLKAKGIKTSELKNEIKHVTKICQKCNEPNSQFSHFCKKCGSPLDLKFVIESDERRRKFEEFLVDFLNYYATKDKNFKKIFVKFVKEKDVKDLFEELKNNTEETSNKNNKEN
ncbi:MAG: site-specific integrase [Candidatus Aenigmatarchaeota archaeon]